MNESSRQPNILVIMTDQHARRVAGCYGDPVVETPSIDRLAEQSLVFDDAYCPAPLCVPSRMAFLTGRYPHRNRVLDNGHMLSSSIPTWAHALGAAGYETALMGKMHFVGPDHRHGFELRPLGEFLARYPGVPELGGPRWTKFPGGTSGQQRVSVDTVGTGFTTYQWFDRAVADAACGYLRQTARERSRGGRPFAAFVGFNLPHCPFVAPKDLFEHYRETVPMPTPEASPPPTVRRFQERRGIANPPVPDEQVRLARAAYYALVTHVDRLIGEVLDTLEQTGQAEETLVVYCSDHGEMAGRHGCWWKSLYYEDAAGVPLIVRYPGMRRAGERTRAVVNLLDLAPTFCDVTDAEMSRLDGSSLLPLLDDPSEDGRFTTTYSELSDPKGGPNPLLSRMIRSGRHKLWRFFDDEELPPVLFDLEDDPEEMHDLSASAEHHGIRKQLEDRLCEGWDPETVAAACEEETEARELFAAYGAHVRPYVPETLAVPLPWVESDVEIV